MTDENYKYTTHEEAEKGYKELESLLGKKDVEIKAAKTAAQQELESLQATFVAPVTYVLDTTTTLDETTKSKLDNVAHDAGLTQVQYTKLAQKLVSENASVAQMAIKTQEEQETALKSIPEYDDKKTKLDIYIDQQYSESLRPVIKERLKSAAFFNDMWKERELKSTTASMPSSGTTVEKSFDTNKMLEVRQKMNDNPQRLELRDEYLQLLKQKAEMSA